MKHGKKYSDSVKAFDLTKSYDAAEAMGVVLETAKAKFDETVELHIRLGVDPRQADQQVRGVLVLPNGTARPAGFWSSPRARRRMRPPRRARITSARRK